MSREKTIAIDLDEDVPDDAGAPISFAPPAATPPAADVVDEDAEALDTLPDHAVQNADGSVTLPLMYPRELQIRKNGKVRSDRYEELTFHRLTGADRRAIAAAREDMLEVTAFARSTRLSQAVMIALFDRMDSADITYGGRVLNSFFGSGRRTGK